MESFRGGGYEQNSRSQLERMEIEKTREVLKKVDQLLAKLLETGQELSTQARQALRQQIQALLFSIGIKGLEDYTGFMVAYERINDNFRTLPIPHGFPSKSEFREKLLEVYEKEEEALPPVPNRLNATQVALYGRGNWTALEGRGGEGVADYLYNLAILMSNKNAYTTAFDDTDVIQVGSDWNIENGRHRVLTLKCLGGKYISRQEMEQ